MMSDIGAQEATPFAELERQMMDTNFPKNEREWWSWREINNLRDTITRLTAELERLNKENALGGVIQSLFGTFLTPFLSRVVARGARIEQLEAALAWIDQQRYTARSTINPANGYDHAIALNEKLIAVMDAARAALTQENSNG
jgi:hypothetical protein